MEAVADAANVNDQVCVEPMLGLLPGSDIQFVQLLVGTNAP